MNSYSSTVTCIFKLTYLLWTIYYQKMIFANWGFLGFWQIWGFLPDFLGSGDFWEFPEFRGQISGFFRIFWNFWEFFEKGISGSKISKIGVFGVFFQNCAQNFLFKNNMGNGAFFIRKCFLRSPGHFRGVCKRGFLMGKVVQCFCHIFTKSTKFQLYHCILGTKNRLFLIKNDHFFGMETNFWHFKERCANSHVILQLSGEFLAKKRALEFFIKKLRENLCFFSARKIA